ncbi:hypothetical protein ACFO4L_01330 [Bacillus daqingensis]|uniref:Nitrogen regulatory protein P-II family n=2 Tax=Bacillaceae TaxID=186817 RepID=A0ABV9NPG1_9BACI
MDGAAVIVVLDRSITKDVLTKLEKEEGVQSHTHWQASGHSSKDGSLMGMKIHPERDCILLIVNKAETSAVIETVKKEADLYEAGQGLVFSVDLMEIAGLRH